MSEIPRYEIRRVTYDIESNDDGDHGSYEYGYGLDIIVWDKHGQIHRYSTHRMDSWDVIWSYQNVHGVLYQHLGDDAAIVAEKVDKEIKLLEEDMDEILSRKVTGLLNPSDTEAKRVEI